MAAATGIEFDLDTFKSGYEEWDIDARLELYADDVELVQIDRDNPPSAPRTRIGKDVLRGMLEHCASAGVRATVENTVASGERAAATITCEFPGGRRVLANDPSVLDLEYRVGDDLAPARELAGDRGGGAVLICHEVFHRRPDARRGAVVEHPLEDLLAVTHTRRA